MKFKDFELSTSKLEQVKEQYAQHIEALRQAENMLLKA